MLFHIGLFLAIEGIFPLYIIGEWAPRTGFFSRNILFVDVCS
jgi:hypothetical protein